MDADAGVAPPVAPDRGSAVGRLLQGFVVNAGVAGTTGALLGGLAGPAGAAVGMTVGVVGAMIFTGRSKAVKDVTKWREYEGQRQQYMAATGEFWPDARKGFGRKAKMVGGTGVALTALGMAGLLPAVTALPAVAFYGSMLAGPYLLRRLMLRRRGADGVDGVGSEYSTPESGQRERHPGLYGQSRAWGGRPAPNTYGDNRGGLTAGTQWGNGRLGLPQPNPVGR